MRFNGISGFCDVKGEYKQALTIWPGILTDEYKQTHRQQVYSHIATKAAGNLNET